MYIATKICPREGRSAFIASEVLVLLLQNILVGFRKKSFITVDFFSGLILSDIKKIWQLSHDCCIRWHLYNFCCVTMNNYFGSSILLPKLIIFFRNLLKALNFDYYNLITYYFQLRNSKIIKVKKVLFTT